MKYRLYIDEVGNSDLRSSKDPNHRFLSLTGIISELEYVKNVLHPLIENIKGKYFKHHPDDPIIFHRKEIINKREKFKELRDENTEAKFNKDILDLIEKSNYEVITIVIDKLEHLHRYQKWHFDPYHYCLLILMERYVLYLRSKRQVGDILAESRGGNDDRRLKASFSNVYERGSDYISLSEFQKHLTSKQLKIKPKSANIAGLQLADLIAHPSFKATWARHEGKELPNNFGGKIANILEHSKYLRDPEEGSVLERIEGWGRKWLP